MVAAARLALLDAGSAHHATNERERYFAKAGEAELGLLSGC